MESVTQRSKNENLLEDERRTAKKYEKVEISDVEMDDVKYLKPEKCEQDLSKAPKGKSKVIDGTICIYFSIIFANICFEKVGNVACYLTPFMCLQKARRNHLILLDFPDYYNKL